MLDTIALFCSTPYRSRQKFSIAQVFPEAKHARKTHIFAAKQRGDGLFCKGQLIDHGAQKSDPIGRAGGYCKGSRQSPIRTPIFGGNLSKSMSGANPSGKDSQKPYGAGQNPRRPKKPYKRTMAGYSSRKRCPRY